MNATSLLAWWSFNNTANDSDLLNATGLDAARSQFGHLLDGNDPFDDGFYDPAAALPGVAPQLPGIDALFPVSDAFSADPGLLIGPGVRDFGPGIPPASGFGAHIDVTDFAGDNFASGTADNWGSFAGTGLNRPSGTFAGGSLSVTGTANNGRSFDIVADLTGFRDIAVSWANRGTGTGFDSRTVSVSTDGTTFTEIFSATGTLGSSFTVETAMAGGLLDNAESAIIRFELDGASSTSGNNRFDNIQLLGTPVTPLISEFQPNPPGSDPATATIELSGVPGAVFSGVLVFIESDAGTANPGDVNDIAPVSGTFDANGLLTVGIPDFENPSFTVVLAESFSGTDATDIDTDNDGIADDLSAFGPILDAIGVPDAASDDGLLYGAQLGGSDFAFAPSGTQAEPEIVFRDASTGALFAVNLIGGTQVFDLAGNAVAPGGFDTDPTAGTTFGAINPSLDGGGGPGAGPTDRFIHEIQGVTNLADGTLVGVPGAADETPLLGQSVRVQAVVTQVLPGLGGFFIQEEDADADADPFTSEGLFVFDNFAGTAVSAGDLVTVEGTAGEFEGQTQIAASLVTVDGTAALPTATVVAFPTATVLEDADGDFVANLEAYEGMRITVPQAMSVTELFQLDRFGTIRLSSDGRLEQFTQGNAPSVAGFVQHLKDVAARSLLIDDGSNAQNPSPILVPGLGADGTLDGGDVFRMGDTYAGLTGVLAFSEDDQTGSEEPEYRLHAPDGTLTAANPRPAGVPDVGGDFTVASFNVLNFFTTLDTFPGNEGVGPDGLDPRGANTNPQNALPGTGALDEFDRQVDKLVAAMVGLGADVFGLIEIENDFLDPGTRPIDTDAQGGRGPAIQFLVDEINAVVGAGTYDWVRPGGEFVGGDAIAVGLIYDTTTTEIAPGTTAAVLTDADLAGLGLAFGNPVFDGPGTSRAPIAATFREIASGEDITVSVNHFKSKGSLSPFGNNADAGDGQGNNTEARVQAATALDAWLDSDPTGSGDPDVLILGDLNAYAEEDPITFLEGQGYTDLAEAFIGAGRSSFVFDGQTGTLDYALANGPLAGQVTGAAEWSINADEPDAFDYNLEFGREAGLFTADAFRSSDHDPVIVGLDLDTPPVVNVVEGGPRRDILRGTDGDDLFLGGGGTDIVITGAGRDVIDFGAVLTNGRRDITLVTDFDAGNDMLGSLSASDVLFEFASGNRTLLILDTLDFVQLLGTGDPSAILYENDLLG